MWWPLSSRCSTKHLSEQLGNLRYAERRRCLLRCCLGRWRHLGRWRRLGRCRALSSSGRSSAAQARRTGRRGLRELNHHRRWQLWQSLVKALAADWLPMPGFSWPRTPWPSNALQECALLPGAEHVPQAFVVAIHPLQVAGGPGASPSWDRCSEVEPLPGRAGQNSKAVLKPTA